MGGEQEMCRPSAVRLPGATLELLCALHLQNVAPWGGHEVP